MFVCAFTPLLFLSVYPSYISFPISMYTGYTYSRHADTYLCIIPSLFALGGDLFFPRFLFLLSFSEHLNVQAHSYTLAVVVVYSYYVFAVLLYGSQSDLSLKAQRTIQPHPSISRNLFSRLYNHNHNWVFLPLSLCLRLRCHCDISYMSTSRASGPLVVRA